MFSKNQKTITLYSVTDTGRSGKTSQLRETVMQYKLAV